MIKKYLIKLFSKKELLERLLKVDEFEIDNFDNNKIWKDAFRGTPELGKWVKTRKMVLLQLALANPKEVDTIKGQILELDFIQRFDTPHYSEPAKVEPKKEIEIDRSSFLSKWNAKNEK